MADFRKDFIAFCIEQGVLGFGQFVTKSGRTTPYFFNAGLFNTGAALERLAQFYAKAILASGVDFAEFHQNWSAIRDYRQLYGVAHHA